MIFKNDSWDVLEIKSTQQDVTFVLENRRDAKYFTLVQTVLEVKTFTENLFGIDEYIKALKSGIENPQDQLNVHFDGKGLIEISITVDFTFQKKKFTWKLQLKPYEPSLLEQLQKERARVFELEELLLQNNIEEYVVFEKSHFELEYSFEDAQIKLKGENRQKGHFYKKDLASDTILAITNNKIEIMDFFDLLNIGIRAPTDDTSSSISEDGVLTLQVKYKVGQKDTQYTYTIELEKYDPDEKVLLQQISQKVLKLEQQVYQQIELIKQTKKMQKQC